MAGKLIILGCGGSAGVPAIGNWWGDCDPNEPRNVRTRPSVALQTENTLVIVDTGPDFREQVNREKLGAPDAIILTHIHSDHIAGIDEMRTFQRLKKRRFPVYMTKETNAVVQERYPYMFQTSEDGFYPTVCEPVLVEEYGDISVGELSIQTYAQQHGHIRSLGLRVGDIAYSTDVKTLPEESFACLEGIKIWIVDAAANESRSNPVHASIGEIIEMNERIQAERVILTHLPPTMDYRKLFHGLPEGYEPGYDGKVFEF
jgi:phosphoribosyl 1,2-cyclic phosphate phosphodiesterase